jgi:hypothetical protein
MLHLLPDSGPRPRSEPYAEAVARLSSVRHALRLVDPHGGGPASDLEDDDAVAAAWDEADDARRRAFDNRSSKLVGATAAGVEALLDEQQKGNAPNEEASKLLVDQIRRELKDVARHIFR